MVVLRDAAMVGSSFGMVCPLARDAALGRGHGRVLPFGMQPAYRHGLLLTLGMQPVRQQPAH